MKTPILYLIYNRPDHVRKSFESIKRVKPKYLYVASDGPKNEKDETLCRVAREYVLNQIDWDCQITTLFRERNLGCRLAVSSAITWFFDQVEKGIILEDDCVASPDFYTFCTELLDYYSADTRIMHISGANYGIDNRETKWSYYFSKYGLVWGWATWRRAWNYYDPEIKKYPELLKLNQFPFYYNNPSELELKMNQYDRLYANEIDTWDYQWSLAKYTQNGLSIIPHVNLVENIGFDEMATHTKTDPNNFSKIGSEAIGQINHPEFIIRNAAFDRYVSGPVVEQRKGWIIRLYTGMKKFVQLIT